MTNTSLDSFESALLTQLRRHVVEQPGTPTTTGRRRRRLLAAAAAGLAATVVGVVGVGGHGGPSPAYAVVLETDGDVVVTVRSLEDAAGLEAALRDRGIDASVSYDPDRGTESGTEGGRIDQAVPAEREQQSAGEEPCGLGTEVATLTRKDDAWVFRIPAGSDLMDRHVEIGTDPGGGLTVLYAGDRPGTDCWLLQGPASG